MKDQIRNRAERLAGDCVKFLRDIIALPSPSGHEAKVVARVIEEMRRLSYDEVKVDRFGNVIGRIGKGSLKLLYDSHVDTVGVGDRANWKFDPFKGRVEKGKVFGRGASDSKGALASMIYGAELYRQLGPEPGLGLYVVGTVMAEGCDGLAQRSLFEIERLVPDFVVVGKATGLSIHRGHRGRAEIRITTKGRSCDASTPERGDNSIYRTIPIVQRIEALDKKLRKDPVLGKGSITVTKIECQTPSLNSVPDSCSIYLDRRLTVGETKKEALEQIKKALRGTKAKVEILCYEAPSYNGFRLPGEKYYPSWVLGEKHLLVQSAVDAFLEVVKKRPAIGCSTLSGNGAYTMGVAKVPTILFGPGEEQFAHTTIDQVPVDQMKRAMMFYAALPKHVLTKLGRRKPVRRRAVTNVFS
jgi:putative selenium metabolism hydrolase